MYGQVDNYSPDYYMSRVASPYPEMDIEQIKNIKIPASENCVLWLWTTHKYIFDCKDILEKWGFRDVSILTWVKNTLGIGKWLRSKTEYCVMAVKGKPLINLTNESTVLMADNKGHSIKPMEFYDMVDKLCVGRKLDYFARDKKKGWDTFGLVKKE
jgi:N6-adenosine-specific RNA methylase IME4